MSSQTVPKLWTMTAFPPDGGDGSTMTPVATDRSVHAVLLTVRRFLLHGTPETEHLGDYNTIH